MKGEPTGRLTSIQVMLLTLRSRDRLSVDEHFVGVRTVQEKPPSVK